MLNVCTITGRLVEDPELRSTKQENVPVTSLRLACRRDYCKNGEAETDFFNVSAWRHTAEFICEHFAKGSMITVVGRLTNRAWKDKFEQNRISTEIVADNVYFGESRRREPAVVCASVSELDSEGCDGDLPFLDGDSSFDDDDDDD
jgi:single-strand DNA-binding protein